MSHTALPFEPLTLPIDGTNLIEASAGTGKTYGIAALFSRLVLLEDISVERILVVTFTKAATAELKNRLRARLEEALYLLDHPQELAQADAFMQALIAAAGYSDSHPLPKLRLKAALSQFDNAAIYTIHGFCQRLLRDYAFLCQAPFDTELAEEQHARLLVPAQDFWRQTVIHDPILAELAFKKHLTPQQLLQDIQPYLGRPALQWKRPDSDLAAARQNVQQLWTAILPQLTELEKAFWQLHPALNGNTYRTNTFKEVFASLKQAAENQQTGTDSKDKLYLLSAEKLADSVKKGQTAPPDLCGRLNILADFAAALATQSTTEEEAVTQLSLDLLAYLKTAVAEHKQNSRERTYDDLLQDVYQALTDGSYADTLADTVANNWQVALIDEFQDTDPLQYEIFRRCFILREIPLFLVGDPKQAIYGFRGADIQAYLQAAADADRHYTLSQNHRSHATLINGIGSLFQQKNRPFVLPDIAYPNVAAARPDSRLKPAPTPIRIRWLQEGESPSHNKAFLRDRSANYCADEIAAVLRQAARGELDYEKNGTTRAVAAGDIAVLVRTAHEGSLITQALKKRGIQSVSIRRDSIFATPEAEALSALLKFWLEPRQGGLLRFVLGGVLFKQTAKALHSLHHDDNLLADYNSAAAAAMETWQRHGFFSALQQFAARYHIESRLLAAGDDRSLTNYLQLAELLATEDQRSHNPTALQQWLAAHIAQAGSSTVGDTAMLRLESDEALVKIVTMHAAKGLQYPLVYCPFAWDAKDPVNKKDWHVLQTPQAPARLLAAHQLDDADFSRLNDDHMSENLRLLYVALTRAEEQLTLYAASCQDTPSNPLVYLLSGGADADLGTAMQGYEDKETRAQILAGNWQQFLHDSPHRSSFEWLTDTPPANTAPPLPLPAHPYRALNLPVRTFTATRYTSFTGLTRTLAERLPQDDLLQPALDAAETLVADTAALPEHPADPYDVFAFPRGTQAGVCLHELLEHFDFRRPAGQQHDAIGATLARYGFEPHWTPAACTMLDAAAQAGLSNGSRLSDMPPSDRLAEMAFVMHMQDFNLPALQRWLAGSSLPPVCIEAAKHLDFATLNGFLNGFIDMVCLDAHQQVCLIDYKSNHLGHAAADYCPAALNEAVAEHHYYLQALIYAIAVARYFQARRLPAPVIHVRYLFLRGLDGSQNGIWSWDIDGRDLQPWLIESTAQTGT